MRTITRWSLALALAGCGTADGPEDPRWTFGEVRTTVDGLEVGVEGEVTRTDAWGSLTGLQIASRWTDGDGVELLADEDGVAYGAEPGETVAFALEVPLRIELLPAEGGHEEVCVEIRADESDLPELTLVGCVSAEP